MSDVRNPVLHAGTPVISAGPRVLGFLREPGQNNESARLLTTRTTTDPLTRTSRAFGARRLVNAATGDADAVTLTALAGQPLMLHTVDGDITLTLGDAAGRPLWARNAQGTVSMVTCEPETEAGRPLAATEQPAGGESRIREQYAYAPFSDGQWKTKNLAGSMTEHRNNAGINRPLSMSATGQPLASEQSLLKPEAGLPDWATTTEADTEAALMVSSTPDATGAPLTTTNAAEVTHVTAYNISGAVKENRLRYTKKDEAKETVTLRDILYRADGVVLSQAAGNGITDTYEYNPRSQMLTRHTTQRPTGHPLGALLISDLHYAYDPAGNRLSLDDKGTDPDWYNNQQVTGLRKYAYDTLYRLISASGRERHLVNPGDRTAGFIWSPYTERYTYDDGDNLTQMIHQGGSGNRTMIMRVSAGSNRAVKMPPSGTTPEPETCFLSGGLQKQLSDGRALSWHADGQLQSVSPVVRDGADNDTEHYHYVDGGTRTRKNRTTQMSDGTQTTITTYAGGTETRRRSLKDTLLLDIVITEDGGVRLIQDAITGGGHVRYSFSDLQGSMGGEADEAGNVTSREEYYPYGGSAGADEEAEAIHDRTRRYSGKERDATGLMYYGWRYYLPECARWLSADPAGTADGLNLFRMVHNNPLVWTDNDGRLPTIKGKTKESPPAENTPQSELQPEPLTDTSICKVFRADGLSPEDMLRQGGIFSKWKDKSLLLKKELTFTMSSRETLEKFYFQSKPSPEALKLDRHVKGTPTGMSPDDSAYVSTTKNFAFALRFVERHLGGGIRPYIYTIHATPNFIDVKNTLGEQNYSKSEEEEFSALDMIRDDQIIGWQTVEFGKKGKFEKNERYRPERYRHLTSGGAQPVLAGFPESHFAWRHAPWNKYAPGPLIPATSQRIRLSIHPQSGG